MLTSLLQNLENTFENRPVMFMRLSKTLSTVALLVASRDSLELFNLLLG